MKHSTEQEFCTILGKIYEYNEETGRGWVRFVEPNANTMQCFHVTSWQCAPSRHPVEGETVVVTMATQSNKEGLFNWQVLRIRGGKKELEKFNVS